MSIDATNLNSLVKNRGEKEKRMFLEIREIRKSFGSGDSKVDVLRGLDLDIAKGEFCVLLGPSGSGKSTLLNIIGGIESADDGSISIEGERLADMKEKKLSQYRRKHLGYIFQMYNLIPNLTVRENIEVGAYLSDRPLDVDELLHTLGLFEHQRKLPNQLSGGQQQRLCIARAMAVQPSVLLMDEPASALDPISTSKIEELICELSSQTTIVIVTHSMQQAARVSNKTAFFYLGEMVEYDETKKIFTNPDKEATQNYITGRFG